jgi:hypothetical protein
MTEAGRPRRGLGRRSDCDYEVGRGKPPVHTRFKPGQSGNPKGRPKGVRNFRTDVQATLKAPVKVTRDGKPRKLSTQEAMLLRLREKALGGDARALDRLIALAQAYNSEELVAAASMSADDATVLEVFKARVLSGAAGTFAPAEGSQTTGEKASSGLPGSASAESDVARRGGREDAARLPRGEGDKTCSK